MAASTVKPEISDITLQWPAHACNSPSIAQIDAFVVVGDKDYVAGAGLHAVDAPGPRALAQIGDLHVCAYPPQAQSCLVRVTADDGTVGWVKPTLRSDRAQRRPWSRTSWRRSCWAATRSRSSSTGRACTAACACAVTLRAFSWRRSPAWTSLCGTWQASCSTCRSTDSSADRFEWSYRSTRPACRAAPSRSASPRPSNSSPRVLARSSIDWPRRH